MSDTKPPSSGGRSGPLSSMNIPCFASAVPVVYHNHPGYVSYLDHIERTVPLYNTSKPNQKWHVIRSIITELQKDGLEFVFLNRDGTWSDYDDDHAHSRATNLMRQFIRYHEDGVPIGEKDIPIFSSSVPATLHNHPGYVSYLDLVQSYVTEYITAKPNHKIVVLRNVLDKMNERDMKFVRFDNSLNTWVDYDDNDLVIKEKIRTLIKMFSKISVDDESRNHVNNSTLNDSTIQLQKGVIMTMKNQVSILLPLLVEKLKYLLLLVIIRTMSKIVTLLLVAILIRLIVMKMKMKMNLRT